jgi:hypothetical protein
MEFKSKKNCSNSLYVALHGLPQNVHRKEETSAIALTAVVRRIVGKRVT